MDDWSVYTGLTALNKRFTVPLAKPLNVLAFHFILAECGLCHFTLLSMDGDVAGVRFDGEIILAFTVLERISFPHVLKYFS